MPTQNIANKLESYGARVTTLYSKPVASHIVLLQKQNLLQNLTFKNAHNDGAQLVQSLISNFYDEFGARGDFLLQIGGQISLESAFNAASKKLAYLETIHGKWIKWSVENQLKVEKVFHFWFKSCIRDAWNLPCNKTLLSRAPSLSMFSYRDFYNAQTSASLSEEAQSFLIHTATCTLRSYQDILWPPHSYSDSAFAVYYQQSLVLIQVYPGTQLLDSNLQNLKSVLNSSSGRDIIIVSPNLPFVSDHRVGTLKQAINQGDQKLTEYWILQYSKLRRFLIEIFAWKENVSAVL